MERENANSLSALEYEKQDPKAFPNKDNMV